MIFKKKWFLIILIIVLLILIIVILPFYRINIKNPSNQPIVVLGLDTELGMQNDVPFVLDFLKQENISATFFVNGDFIEQHLDIAKLIANSSNEFASHSHVHVNHAKLNEQQQDMLIKDQKIIAKQLLDKEVIGFRAPYRMINSKTLKILKYQGFKYSADYHCNNHPFIFPLSKITPHPTSCNKNSFIYILPGIFGYPIDDDYLFRYSKLSEEKALKITKEAFDKSIKEKNVFIFAGHPSMVWSKINYFRSFIEYAKSKNAIFLTHAQLQELIDKNPKLVKIN